MDIDEWPSWEERETYVCDECAVDPILAELVLKNLASSKCSYCDREPSAALIAAPFNIVMERIYDTVTMDFADAQDVDMPWAEGGWIMQETWGSDVLGYYDPGWGAALLDDFLGSLDPGDKYWVEHSKGDWALENPSTALMSGWEGFCTQILERTRYLVLSEPEDEWSSGRPDYIPVAQMLNAIGVLCRKFDLIYTIPAGTSFYRVRTRCDGGESFTSFETLGVPPMGVPTAGRMNPPGIPYFYLALDSETAREEVLYLDTNYTIAEFKNKEDLTLLNFVELPPIPSVFEPEKYDERHNVIFLRRLRDALTAEIKKDGREHIDYIPTQVVSEYFRYRFNDNQGSRVDGLYYPSVKNPAGMNAVIFESDNDELKKRFELNSVIEFDAEVLGGK